MQAIFRSFFTDETYIFSICVPGKTSGITYYGSNAFTSLHLIEHGAFDLSTHIYQTFIRTDYNHVVICQSDIARCVTVKQIVIHVNYRNYFSCTINLDIT